MIVVVQVSFFSLADEAESHVDYEDKFTDSYGEAERHSTRPEEAQGEVYEKVHGASYLMGKTSQEQQEVSFDMEVEDHRDHGEQEVVAEGDRDADRAVEDFIGHPSWEQESREEVRTNAPAPSTDAPVSLLSQKHLFWFPSEAFQDQGHPVSTQTVQRASGAQSEESKEHESQESHLHQRPVDVQPDSYDEDDRDTDDQDDHDDSDHVDPALPGATDDSRHDDHDDHDDHEDDGDHSDSRHDDHSDHDDLEDLHSQEEQDRKDPMKPYTPSYRDREDDHNDHYDMGEHEDERDRVRYGSQEYDDREDVYEERESYEDREATTDDGRDDGDAGDPDRSDHDDHDDDAEEDDLDRYTDHHDDHDDHEDHDVDHDDSYDDRDSHEEAGQHVIFSVAKDHENVTQRGGEEGGEATTDDTWLDGYPVVLGETENVESTTGNEGRERGTVDRPNEVDIGRPTPHPGLPEETPEPASEQEGAMEVWPTAAPSSPDLSDSSLHPEDLDYDTQQPAPTRSGLGDLTEHPFLDHDLAPPVNDGDLSLEGHTVRDLPGEAGERGEMEGEMGETICTGDGCPPPSSPSRGPTVAAVIVVLCALATAVIVGVWCYRRQQQKSSMYEMNGKGGQSQSRQGQHIEMQQKV